MANGEVLGQWMKGLQTHWALKSQLFIRDLRAVFGTPMSHVLASCWFLREVWPLEVQANVSLVCLWDACLPLKIHAACRLYQSLSLPPFISPHSLSLLPAPQLLGSTALLSYTPASVGIQERVA